MIYFTAHTFKCVCHCRRAMFRVLGMYNFDLNTNYRQRKLEAFFEKFVAFSEYMNFNIWNIYHKRVK